MVSRGSSRRADAEAWHGAWEPVLFWLLLAVLALPVLLFEYMPSEDGPAHVANAMIILNSHAPMVSEYYNVSFSGGTNLLGDLLLVGLLTIVSGPVANKLMSLSFLIGLPLAVRWCLRQIDADAAWLSVFAIPIGGGVFLYYGFYNFSVGVVLSFVALGVYLKLAMSGKPVARIWMVVGPLLGLVYLAHPLPALASVAMIAGYEWDRARSDAAAIGRDSRRLVAGRLLPSLAASLLILVLLALFAADLDTRIVYAGNPFTRLRHFPIDVVLSLTRMELPAVLVFSTALALLGIVALFQAKERTTNAGFLLAALLFAFAYFVGPNSVGVASLLIPRALLFCVLAGLLWLATARLQRWIRNTSIAMVALAIVGLCVVRIPLHRDADGFIREYLSGRAVIAEDSTVLPLWAASMEGEANAWLRPAHADHVSDYLAGRDVVDLYHFTAQDPISAVEFRPGFGIKALLGIEDLDETLRFEGDVLNLGQYEQRGLGRIDYVWLWGRARADPALLDQQNLQRVLSVLDVDYELVYTSSPRGLLEVYARRAPSDQPRGVNGPDVLTSP